MNHLFKKFFQFRVLFGAAILLIPNIVRVA